MSHAGVHTAFINLILAKICHREDNAKRLSGCTTVSKIRYIKMVHSRVLLSAFYLSFIAHAWDSSERWIKFLYWIVWENFNFGQLTTILAKQINRFSCGSKLWEKEWVYTIGATKWFVITWWWSLMRKSIHVGVRNGVCCVLQLQVLIFRSRLQWSNIFISNFPSLTHCKN